MFYQVLKLFILLIVALKEIKCQNSTEPMTKGRKFPNKIVGGQTTSISSVPYQVAVVASGSICGGSLITQSVVLTAAHCVTGRSASSITVRAGSNYYNRYGVVMSVAQAISNENFNFQTMTHDIAVLRLSRSLTASEMTSYNIKVIPVEKVQPPDNAMVIVSGYGKLSTNGPLATSLQSVVVNTINWNQCNRSYGGKLTKTMICAGSPFGGRDSCQGDSGGPLAYQGKLLGVVSWGYGCASSRYPGIYTSVPSMLSWIQAMVGEPL